MVAKELRAALPRRFDVYEERALDAAIDKAGALVEANGTDLSTWEAEQVTEFCRTIVVGFGTSLRAQVAEGQAPF